MTFPKELARCVLAAACFILTGAIAVSQSSGPAQQAPPSPPAKKEAAAPPAPPSAQESPQTPLAQQALAQQPPPAPGGNQPQAAAPPAVKVYLGYRWTNVGLARYKVSMSEESKAQLPLGPSVQTKLSEYDLSFTPVGSENGMTWVEMRFDRAKMQVSPQGIDVDSSVTDNPKAGPLAPLPAVYAAIKGKAVRALVSPGGRIQKVEGLQDLVAAARAAMPDSPVRDALLALMIPTDEKALTGRFADVFLSLPAEHVNPGFTEQEDWPAPVAGGTLKRTLTFGKTEDDAGQTVAVVTQDLTGQNLPATPVPAQKLVVSTTSYDNDAIELLGVNLGIPVRTEDSVTTDQAVRKEGTPPTAPPDFTVHSVTKTTTTLIASEPKSQPSAAAATAQANTGQPQPNGGPPTEPPAATAQAKVEQQQKKQGVAPPPVPAP